MLGRVKSLIRPFLYSPEVTLSEQFAYGHREIYQRFIGFDPKKIILAELQHGWAPDSSLLIQGENSNRLRNRRLRRYPLLVWSRELAQEINCPKNKSVHALASPWSLLVRNYENLKSKGAAPNYFEVPKSALYFPTHSFPGVEASLDSKKIEIALKSHNFSSITTSLYWVDFIDPKIRELYQRFSRVTCMGLRAPAASEVPWSNIGGRVNFLYQLHRTISEHQYIICEDLSTAAMAALTLGKEVFITKDKVFFKIIHRHEKNVMSELDNSKILDRYNIKKADHGLGYNLNDNSNVFELAKLGFGFDISIDETRKVIELFLGYPSIDLQNQASAEPLDNLLW